VGATLRISGMCILCSSAGTLTTIAQTSSARTNNGDERDSHRLYVRHIYLAKLYFGEERIGPMYCMNFICMCRNELNFE
jgi:hypothetical protein